MSKRRGGAAAALTALALTFGLSTTSFADVIAGLILNLPDEESSSQEVTGTFDGGDGLAAGVLISDSALLSLDGEVVHDGGSASYDGSVDIVTQGQNGGAGVLVRSFNDPVTATVSGSIINRDESVSGAIDSVTYSSAGIAALSYYAGNITLNSNADVRAIGTSAGLPGAKMSSAAVGVLLHTNDNYEVAYNFCYEDDNGVMVPIQVDRGSGAAPFTIEDESGTWTNENVQDLYAIFVGDERVENHPWDLYFIKEDGTVVAKSKEQLPYSDHDIFRGINADNPEDTDPRPITVTMQSDADDEGTEVTIAVDKSRDSLLGGYSYNGDTFIAKDSFDKHIWDVEAGDEIIFFLVDGAPTYEVKTKTISGPLNTEAISITSELSGSINAQADGAAPEAIGLYAYSLSGQINADLHDLSIESRALRPVGIYSNGSGANAINGSGNVTIDVEATGENPAPTGILSMIATGGTKSSNLSILGSGNSLNVQTDGPSSASNVRQLTSGIRSNTSGAVAQITNPVRFEGPVTVTDKSPEGAAFGLYTQAMYKGTSVIEVIGDITVNAAGGAGIYSQINMGNSMLRWIPEIREYVRGNVTFNNAGDSVRGIRAHGGTVVLDGDLTVKGSGTKMQGIYAETSPMFKDGTALVYVSGTIDAPYACRLVADINSETTQSRAYLWDYTQEFTTPNPSARNVNENIGSVIKYNETLGNVVLSSDDAGFVALDRDDRTYYGALEGNTVTVSNCDPAVYLEIQDARGNVLEIQDPAETHTFTVPTTFESGKAEQLGIYLTVHEHDWAEPTYQWSDDNSTVTATRVCKHDSSHTESETVEVAREVIAPTCTDEGKTNLTAEFENEAFATQTKTVDPVKALGHEWGAPTYTWKTIGTGKKTVTATRTCTRDSSHVETETVTATAKVTKQATTTTTGVRTYTASFTNSAFATQTTTETIPVTAANTQKRQATSTATKATKATPSTSTSTLASTGDTTNLRLGVFLAGMGVSLFVAGVLAKRKQAR